MCLEFSRVLFRSPLLSSTGDGPGAVDLSADRRRGFEQRFTGRRQSDPTGRPFEQIDVEVGLEGTRSEEHTSELQSRGHLVCRLLLEKKKKRTTGPKQSNLSQATKRRT